MSPLAWGPGSVAETLPPLPVNNVAAQLVINSRDLGSSGTSMGAPVNNSASPPESSSPPSSLRVPMYRDIFKMPNLSESGSDSDAVLKSESDSSDSHNASFSKPFGTMQPEDSFTNSSFRDPFSSLVVPGWKRLDKPTSLAVDAVDALRSLAGLGPAQRGRPSDADSAELERIKGDCRAFLATEKSVEFSSDESSFWKIVGSQEPKPSGEGNHSNNLGRGDIVPAELDRMAFPDGSRGKARLRDFLPEFEADSFLRDDPLPESVIEAMPSYSDPLFSSEFGSIGVALAFYKCGMVKPVISDMRVPVPVDCFTVMKETEPSVTQRIVFDLRRVNMLFRKPPRTTLGSGDAISRLDLCESDHEEGNEFAAFVGDIPSFFYRLEDESLAPLFRFNCDFDAFLVAGVKEGLFSDAQAKEWICEGCDSLGFTVVLMGWSWAVHFAQSTLEKLLERAGNRVNVLHKVPTPGTGDTDPVMAYIDDFFGLKRGHTRAEAREKAESRLKRMHNCATECGLDVHKDYVSTETFDSIGFRIDLRAAGRTNGVNSPSSCPGPRATPKPGKFIPLVRATRHFASLKFIKPRNAYRILGSWSWAIILRREFYAILQHTYIWLNKHVNTITAEDVRMPLCFDRKQAAWDRPVAVPFQVREELNLLVRLAPLLRARLDLRATDKVFCSDACLGGGAVCYRSLPTERTAELIRTAASWEAAVDETVACSTELFEPQRWKVACKFSFKHPELIDGLEGRTAAVAAQRAVRDRATRSAKQLMFIDSQSFLGAVRKGRSSFWRLLKPCRTISAYSIFSDVKFVWRYVRSEYNPSDGPSRGSLYPGVIGCPATEAAQGVMASSSWTSRFGAASRLEGSAAARVALRTEPARPVPARLHPRATASSGTTTRTTATASGLRSSLTPGRTATSSSSRSGRGSGLRDAPPRLTRERPARSAPSSSSARRESSRAGLTCRSTGTSRTRTTSSATRRPTKTSAASNTTGCAPSSTDAGTRTARSSATATRAEAKGSSDRVVLRLTRERHASEPVHGKTKYFEWEIQQLGISPLISIGLLRDVVDDSTSGKYMTAIRDFQGFLNAACGLSKLSFKQADFMLGKYIDALHQTGLESEPPRSFLQKATHTLSSLMHAYPNSKGQWPLGARALKGFRKKKPPGERDPLPFVLMGAIIVFLASQGLYNVALAVWLHFDCLMRTEELCTLTVMNIVFSFVGGKKRAAILLGKTKNRKLKEGCVVEHSVLVDLLEELVQGKDGDELVFGIDRDEYLGYFHQACMQMLGDSNEWVPHCLRHGGASWLIQDKSWSVENIVIRGRWAYISSCRRYTKGHRIVKVLSDAPRRAVRIGKLFEAFPAEFLRFARDYSSLDFVAPAHLSLFAVQASL